MEVGVDKMCMKRVTVRENANLFVRCDVFHKLTALMMAAGKRYLNSLKLIKDNCFADK